MNDPARRTDRELFEAAASGETDALAALLDRYARGLYDFALRGTLDEQQAAAAIEAVFRRIQTPGAGIPSQIDFRTWLYSLGLVEVLAVSTATRTARISTDDERLYEPTSGVDLEIAHWAWQAARGLRTRDYCVLDLTLRRGLTPEEVAEAASLTRSNLYASIGRARGAFEETFAAMLLFEQGRDTCAPLDEIVENAPGNSLRPALRHQIVEHADGCDACRDTLGALPPAANVYVSLAEIAMPEALVQHLSVAALAISPPPWPEHEPSDIDLAQPRTLHGDSDALTGALIATQHITSEDDDFEDLDEASEGGDEADIVPENDKDRDEASLFLPSDMGAATAAALSLEPRPAPVTPVHRETLAYDYPEEGFRDRLATWVGRARTQPVLWTYILLGVLAVIAIYLGVAVADSLQSGGRDSGAVPLDAPPGTTSGRTIDCGDAPFEMNADEPLLLSFDEAPLDGFQITSVTHTPISGFVAAEDLEVTLEGPYSMHLAADQIETSAAGSAEFELRILWQRGDELANSTCRLVVRLAP